MLTYLVRTFPFRLRFNLLPDLVKVGELVFPVKELGPLSATHVVVKL